MIKFLLLHLLRWTVILALCVIAVCAGIFLLDFRHTINADVKMNFIYTCIITLAAIPVTAMLLGGLRLIKKAMDKHKAQTIVEQAAADVV